MRVGRERQDALREALERSGAERRETRGAGELWRYALDGGHVTLWRTGTVLVQGKGEGAEVLRRLVERFAVPDRPATETPPDRTLGDPAAHRTPTHTGQAGGAPARGRAAAARATEEPASPDRAAPSGLPSDLPRDVAWIGVDESGKGDYFGPLVSAAVLVDPDAAPRLAGLGVRDSKRLSDARVAALAPRIRDLVANAVTVVAPPRYNTLYDELRGEGKRLNQLLAWAHARSMSELLERAAAERAPAYAVVDQFADPAVLERASAARTGGLRIVQLPRAEEADVAVAAASVLARAAFLDWLDRASRRLGTTLPKGASAQVVEAARAVVERHGRDALASVAKLHFVTTEKVLG